MIKPEENVTEQTPQPTQMANSGEDKHIVGPVIGIIVIIGIIILGGLYFWMVRNNSDTTSQQENSQVNQGPADSVSNLEAELKSNEVGNMDAKLNNIDQSMTQ